MNLQTKKLKWNTNLSFHNDACSFDLFGESFGHANEKLSKNYWTIILD